MKISMKDYIYEQDKVISNVLKNVPKEIDEKLPDDFHSINKLILVGSGTSYNAIVAAKFMFNELLPYVVEITNPFDFINYYPKHKINHKTLLIGVSQTARSTGVINAIEMAKSCSARTLFITASPFAEGAKTAESVIYTWTGVENVGPKTKGFTSTIVTLYLLAFALSGSSRDLASAPKQISHSVKVSKSINDAFTDRFYSAPSLTIVGYGPNMAVAYEGGLKISETVRIPVEAYNVEEYMHGPYHCLNEKSYMIFISSPGISQPRMNQLVKYAEKISSHIVVITDANNTLSSETSMIIRMDPDIDDFLSPLSYVIPLQLFAYELTRKLGRQPEESGHPDFHASLGSKQIAKLQ